MSFEFFPIGGARGVEEGMGASGTESRLVPATAAADGSSFEVDAGAITVVFGIKKKKSAAARTASIEPRSANFIPFTISRKIAGGNV